MRKTIAAVAATAAIAAGIVTPAVADAGTGRVKLPASVSKPCRTEDSVNCFWNAKQHGNGRGRSYIVRYMRGHRGHPGLTCVFYIAKRDAKRDYCA